MLLRTTVFGFALLFGSGSVFAAAEQPVQRDYPSKPIRVVGPYAAGGPMDYTGRMLGKKLQNLMTLVIDNRPEAGGALGTDVVAKSAPDGYTMLHTSSSHASLPVITKSLPYDPVKDFVPITLAVKSDCSPAPRQSGKAESAGHHRVYSLEDQEIRRAFAERGFVSVGSTSAEFAKTIVAEIETNKRLAAKIGLTPE